MVRVVVDIDDTLICSDRRMCGVWRAVLGRVIPPEDVATLSLEQIFARYASEEQKASVGKFQKRFWDIVLCLDKTGIELLELNDPIPHAADVLQRWSGTCKLFYLTGRTENMRELTLTELEKHGFPVNNTQVVMSDVKDFARARGLNPSGPTLIDARSRLFNSILEAGRVARVIDDYPSYFPIYKDANVPDRIGLLRPKKYSQQQYIDRGATRVIQDWIELEDDPPKPPQLPPQRHSMEEDSTSL